MPTVRQVHPDELELNDDRCLTIRNNTTFKWPLTIEEVELPKPVDARDDPKNLASFTAFHLARAIHMCGHKFLPLIEDSDA
ncbi:hypothetical protein PWT90_11274 [Aphanocladium album]|nr:hypothetical protein PWT90_11274 [Aphanocladium album]